MKVVLLPGLDGTGRLFDPLVQAFSASVDVQIISYEADEKASYEELVSQVWDALPSEEFVLVAESFSGVIAYEIGLRQPKYLKHIIFVATFLQSPRPLLLPWIFSKYMLLKWIPDFVVKLFFLGRSVSQETLGLFQKTLTCVDRDVLFSRLMLIRKLQLKKEPLMIASTYIEAREDMLVPNHSVETFKMVCKKLDVLCLKGPHLLLQASPKESAEVLEEIFERACVS